MEAKPDAINVLSEDQEELSNRFARAGSNKWDGICPSEGRFGAPLLPDVLVALECETYARHEGGDHELFISRVLAIHEGGSRSIRWICQLVCMPNFNRARHMKSNTTIYL